MELEVTIIGAVDLKDVRHLARMQTRAIVWIDPNERYSTQIDETSGINPKWNEKFLFYVPSKVFEDDNKHLHIEVHSGSFTGSRLVGKAMILLGEMAKNGIDKLHYAAYPLQRPQGHPQGTLYIAYKLGPKTFGDLTVANTEDIEPGYYHDTPSSSPSRSILKKTTQEKSLAPGKKKHVTFEDGTRPSYHVLSNGKHELLSNSIALQNASSHHKPSTWDTQEDKSSSTSFAVNNSTNLASTTLPFQEEFHVPHTTLDDPRKDAPTTQTLISLNPTLATYEKHVPIKSVKEMSSKGGFHGFIFGGRLGQLLLSRL